MASKVEDVDSVLVQAREAVLAVAVADMAQAVVSVMAAALAVEVTADSVEVEEDDENEGRQTLFLWKSATPLKTPPLPAAFNPWILAVPAISVRPGIKATLHIGYLRNISRISSS